MVPVTYWLHFGKTYLRIKWTFTLLEFKLWKIFYFYLWFESKFIFIFLTVCRINRHNYCLISRNNVLLILTDKFIDRTDYNLKYQFQWFFTTHNLGFILNLYTNAALWASNSQVSPSTVQQSVVCSKGVFNFPFYWHCKRHIIKSSLLNTKLNDGIKNFYLPKKILCLP